METDANGSNDYVYATALVQTLRLNINESPFYGDWGIPARASIISQIAPDYNTMLTQQRYAPNFASLVISKLPRVDQNVNPIYRVNITTHKGVQILFNLPT